MKSRGPSLFSLPVLCASLALAGPPFQTDDPEPVDLHHYEFYVFGATDGTPLETDFSGPAVEFNWGAVPNLQVHIVLPFGGIAPAGEQRAYGLTDTEFGIKYRYLKETKHRPMIGTFTMLEIPTGSYSRGLGIGKVWYKLPVWVQKSWGPWTTYGGAGYEIVPQIGYRNFPFGGWLVQRDLGKKLTLGAEIFSHGAEGPAAPQTEAATLIDFGGYYYFRNPGFQLLFCYGHSVAGQTENYGYLGLYWTWGSKEGKSAAFLPHPHSPAGF